MTCREMVEACVRDQIERGIIPPDAFEYQVTARVKGGRGMMKMTKSQCERWYKAVFGEDAANTR